MEKELAALKEEFRKLKEAFDRCIQPVDPIDLTTHTFHLGLVQKVKYKDRRHTSDCFFLHQVRGEALGGGGAAGGVGSGEKRLGSAAASCKS